MGDAVIPKILGRFGRSVLRYEFFMMLCKSENVVFNVVLFSIPLHTVHTDGLSLCDGPHRR
jgi:hypothetical protein